MQSEESVEVDRRVRRAGDGPRNRDRRTHRVVRALAVRHDDVQRVGRAALEEKDQHLAAPVALQSGALEQILREHGAAQEAGIESHRGERHRARLHENSTIHIAILYMLPGLPQTADYRRWNSGAPSARPTTCGSPCRFTGRPKPGICAAGPRGNPLPSRLRLLLSAATTAPSAVGQCPSSSYPPCRSRRWPAEHRILAAHEHLPRLRRHLSAEHRLHDAIHLLRARLRAQRREVGPVRERRARHLTRREAETEVDAIQDRARVHPRVAAIRPSVGRLPAEDRLAEPRHESARCAASCPGCAFTARSALATTSNGVFTLARYAARLKNSGDRDDAAQRLANVAVGLA